MSRIYGVSPKAVRDIWNKRTWRHATRTLWTEDDEMQHAKNLKAVDDISAQKAAAKQKSPSLRSVGRPRGSKDSKPRKPRQLRHGDDCSRLASPPDSSHDPAVHDEDSAQLTLATPPSDDCLDASRPAGAPHDTEDSGAESAASPAREEEEALYRHFPFFLHFPLSVTDDAVDAA